MRAPPHAWRIHRHSHDLDCGMIVRDIFVPRWGAAAPAASDVTRVPGESEGLRATGKSPVNRANPLN